MNYTDTILVLSDIHGNLFALKAILDDVKDLSIRHIFIAGDHFGDGPQPREVIDTIINSNAHVIKGNREEYLMDYIDGKHEDWHHALQMKAFIWNQAQFNDDHIRWIRSLPEQYTLTLHDTTMRMVHGSPRKVNELIHHDDAELIMEALASVDEDILICGHCHQQYHTTVNGTLIVNPGAAGLPFMPPGSAPYTLLHYTDHGWMVEECRAHYDLDTYLKSFDGSYIQCGAWVRSVIASLKSGKVVTLRFLKHAANHARSFGWDGRGLIPNNYWEEADKTFPWHLYM